jgi:DNA-binding NtrC family response regulator
MIMKERVNKQSALVQQLNLLRSEIILKTCQQEAWHLGRVAERLGIYRSQLYEFIKADPALTQ